MFSVSYGLVLVCDISVDKEAHTVNFKLLPCSLDQLHFQFRFSFEDAHSENQLQNKGRKRSLGSWKITSSNYTNLTRTRTDCTWKMMSAQVIVCRSSTWTALSKISQTLSRYVTSTGCCCKINDPSGVCSRSLCSWWRHILPTCCNSCCITIPLRTEVSTKPTEKLCSH